METWVIHLFYATLLKIYFTIAEGTLQSHDGTNGAIGQEMALTALDKYKFKPFLGSSHSWAIEEACRLPRDIGVLDIGCGSSDIGRALKEFGFTDLCAIEVDESARKAAESVYAKVGGSLDEFKERKFGLVLLLDVVEHLPNPEEFLASVARIIKPGGTLLISVPNVAHWSVRIPLLFGIFNYTDRAILDKTHLQFFTRARLRSLLVKESLFELVSIGATIEPAEFVLPKVIWDNPVFKLISKFRLAVANLLPGLMAYQHVAVLRRVS